MPISIVERLTLYADQTGLVASLRAQPLTAAGVATGALITTGFVALGGADYRFAGSVPDDTECVRYELSSDAGVAVSVGERVANLLLTEATAASAASAATAAAQATTAATQATQANTRVQTGVPNAAPGTATGLPRTQDIPESAGLTPEERVLLQRTAAIVGAFGSEQTRTGNTITERMELPDEGGTIVRTHVRSGNVTTTTVVEE